MKQLNEADFDHAIESGTVLIDFSAEWCGPCKVLTPLLERVAMEYDGKLRIFKVDVDEAQSVAARHGVMSLPTVVIFRDGQAVERRIGSVRESELRSMIDRHM